MEYFSVILKTIVFYIVIVILSKTIFKTTKNKFTVIDFSYYISIIIIFSISIFTSDSIIVAFLSVTLLCLFKVFNKYIPNSSIKKVIHKNKDFPIPIIINGKVNQKNLSLINKDEIWLKNSISEELNNIFYAFYQNNQLFLIKKPI